METKKSKKPIVNANVHGVSVAIWDNKNKAGKDYQNISFSASTKQKDGSYKTRNIFFPSDLGNLITALTELKEKADDLNIQTEYRKK